MGRSNIKTVAQKRFQEIGLFIRSLFLCAHEIAHSELVYTFFHPLLRDQQYPDEYSKKAKGNQPFSFIKFYRLANFGTIKLIKNVVIS